MTSFSDSTTIEVIAIKVNIMKIKKLTFNIFMVLIQMAALSATDNLTSTIETTEKDMKFTTQMTPSTTVLHETKQSDEKSEKGRTAILRIEPEEQETAKIVDILMEQLVEKEKLNNNVTLENGEATTESIDTGKESLIVDNSTHPNVGLTDSNKQQNIEIVTTDRIADPAKLEGKLPDERIYSSTSPTSQSERPEVQESRDRKSPLVNIIVEQTEPRQDRQTGIIEPSSSAQPYSENGFLDQEKSNYENTDSKQLSPIESTTTSLEHTQAIPVVLSRGSEVQHKIENEVSEAHVEKESKVEKRDEHKKANDQQPTETSESHILEPTEVPIQVTNIEPEKVEETSEIVLEKTEKPSLLERMKHNRHRKYKSEEEEDKSEGPVPCTCGVFLSGQFKKGSKQQPKGMPVLTQEMDTPFMNNAVGNRQCTNKCLELIIKHLPKSSEIICATVDRENVFKERAYLFVKNHSDKWHGTNLSAGREFCCKDNTPYKCPVS